MSGLGHLAAGFALKPAAPEVPLWVLLAAGEVNDILYGVLTLSGVSQASEITYDIQHGAGNLSQAADPWSHGLFMSLVLACAAALAARLVFRRWKPAAAVGLAVASHWLLDFLMHANLPLFFAGSPLVGVGLENSGPGFIFMTALDLALLGISLAVYVKYRRNSKAGASLKA